MKSAIEKMTAVLMTVVQNAAEKIEVVITENKKVEDTALVTIVAVQMVEMIDFGLVTYLMIFEMIFGLNN